MNLSTLLEKIEILEYSMSLNKVVINYRLGYRSDVLEILPEAACRLLFKARAIKGWTIEHSIILIHTDTYYSWTTYVKLTEFVKPVAKLMAAHAIIEAEAKAISHRAVSRGDLSGDYSVRP